MTISNSLMTLGPYALVDLETPEKVCVKAKQRLVVHHLGSGSSMVESLGEDYETVSFSGIFSGTNVTGRIQQFETLRLQALPIPLTWSSTTLSVIILRIELDYTSHQWVPYRMSCYVVSANSLLLASQLEEQEDSADTQVSEALEILDNTSVVPSSGQISALTGLAAGNYDVAPSVAIQEVSALLSSIDNSIEATNVISWADLSQNGSRVEFQAKLLSLLALTTGRQAALILGRNRIAEISVNAQCVSQR